MTLIKFMGLLYIILFISNKEFLILNSGNFLKSIEKNYRSCFWLVCVLSLCVFMHIHIHIHTIRRLKNKFQRFHYKINKPDNYSFSLFNCEKKVYFAKYL